MLQKNTTTDNVMIVGMLNLIIIILRITIIIIVRPMKNSIIKHSDNSVLSSVSVILKGSSHRYLNIN